MYSQCPECQTRFRVTAVALRAAHGTVRCGRCGSAFDALQRLTDTVPDDAEPAASVRTRASALAAFEASGRRAGSAGRDDDDAVVVPDLGGDADGDAGTEFHFSADDIERVFIDARDWQHRFPSPGPGAAERRHAAATPSHGAASSHESSANDEELDADTGAAIAGAGAPVVFVHEPEAIEDITLEGERVVIEGLPDLDDDLREIVRDGEAVDDAGPLPAGGAAPVDPDSTDRFEALRNVPETADADGTARAGDPAPSALPPIVPFRLRQREFPVETQAATDLGDDTGTPRRAGVLWGVGVLLLAGLLGVQVVHHFRQQLAREPSVGPLVRSAYARIGRPLAPNWDLGAFELRQWGASESAPAAPGTLEVRASLRNGAGFAQPLPLLRLELEDRFGDTVARRDFEPGEYLNDPAQAPRMLAPGSTTEAALTVVDEGVDAVGYRLDVCMRDDAQVTRCAQSGPHDRPAAAP